MKNYPETRSEKIEISSLRHTIQQMVHTTIHGNTFYDKLQRQEKQLVRDALKAQRGALLAEFPADRANLDRWARAHAINKQGDQYSVPDPLGGYGRQLL